MLRPNLTRFFFTIVLSLVLAASLEALTITAKELQFGSIDCLNSSDPEAKKNTSCELSAVVYVKDGRLFLANDQAMPPKIPSAIQWINVPKTSARHIQPEGYIRQAAIATARKFEEMTLTPHGTLLAMTGFDRYLDHDASLDPFCELLSFDWERPTFAHSITGIMIEGQLVPLRKAMAMAIRTETGAEPPYLKVEALTALDGQTLLFGVREMGKNYSECSDQIRFLQIGYREISLGIIELVGNFKQIYFLSEEKQKEIMHSYESAKSYQISGVSSFVFDYHKDRLYFITTHEGAGKTLENGVETKSIDGYLWWITKEDLLSHKMPHPVLDLNGKPLHMKGHKPEGMTFLPDGSLFVICDEDRVESKMKEGEPLRSRDEAPYYIFGIKETS